MKCPACGNENQPSAKFCVHCGVMLSAVLAEATLTTSVAAPPAVPIYMPPPRPAPAPVVAVAPAAPAPAASTASSPEPAASTASSPDPAAPAAVSLASAAAPGPESPRKSGLIVAAVAVAVVLAGGGYFGYRMLAGSAKKEMVATAEPAKPAEAPTPAPAAEPPKDMSAPATSTRPIETATPAAEPTKSATAAPEEAPMPGTPAGTAASTPKKPAQPKAAPKPAPVIGEQAPATAPQPSPKAPAKPAPVVAAAPAAAAEPDRWQMYADAMGRCGREDFFKRFSCEQRARLYYCEGYWGQVAQCPSAPTRDHGQ
ncbi:MAG: zinc-ribbon domain-containing protein [Betaproteobacteria bacterium]|nr:MAG: zinc-ribbon domain-containing protein [Betaproteobacteria bacterium]